MEAMLWNLVGYIFIISSCLLIQGSAMLSFVIFIFGVIVTLSVLMGYFYEFHHSSAIPHNNASDETNRVDYDGMGDYSRYPKIERD